MDKYLEAKAANFNYIRQKTMSEMGISGAESMPQLNRSAAAAIKSARLLSRRQEALTAANEPNGNDEEEDSFRQSSVNLLANQLKLEADSKNKTTSSISEKFVEQQRKYLPSYKRKKDAKRVVQSADIDKFIGTFFSAWFSLSEMKRLNEMFRA